MKKIIQGIIEFRKNFNEEQRTLFAQLAIEQKPDALFIGCSDSRVVPHLFSSTHPGDLFVVRNIGNLVPPFSAPLPDSSIAAALEFSILTLKVSDVIICGHSECGAMQALDRGIETLSCSHLRTWLKYGECSLYKAKTGILMNPSLASHNLISQVNVIQQIQNLKSYPLIQKKLEEKTLRIHGWWFDIVQADVYYYQQDLNMFTLINAQEARSLLQTL